ncbi:MAG: hypothetical protein R3F62_00135 [Planctomycetota bacterium]
MSRTVLRLLAVCLLASTLGIGWGVAPSSDPDLDDLAAALAEVEASCPCAARPRPAAWDRVLQTLERNPWVLASEQGELPGLQREASWLRDTAEGAPTGARSAGDRRFVHGFLHTYLAALCAHARAERGVAQATRGHRGLPELTPRRELAGLDFADFLGLLD